MGFYMDGTRLFIVLIPQTITILSFAFIAYKILSRRKDKTSLLLSSFYICMVIGFIINLISLSLISLEILVGNLIKVFYYTVFYLILFSFIFLVLFIMSISSVNTLTNSKIIASILIIYGISSFLIVCQPGGIEFIDENYTIYFNTNLMISSYIFIFISIIIPSFYFSLKNKDKITHPSLKKKYKLFTIGLIVKYLDLYGAILYNSWHNPLFRIIWSGITSFLLVVSAFLIYYGVGKNLRPVK